MLNMDEVNSNVSDRGEGVNVEKDYVEFNTGKYFNKVRENPWILSTIVLGIVLIIVLFANGNGITGNVVSEEGVGQNVLDFVEKNVEGGAEIVSVERDGSFYNVVLSMQGEEVPVFVTLDGEYLIPPTGLIPLASADTGSSGSEDSNVEVSKSDRPKVELFVWSYCPYGVQAQGPVAEVASLLKDSADFEAVMFHDGHGEYEAQQNKIQGCIQKLDSDNYWDYAEGFVNDIYNKCGASRDVECDRTESIKLMDSLGIDSGAIMECVENEGEEILADYRARASENGVSGSPTVIINGVKANVARDAESIKTTVCSAFNSAPDACGEVLSSASGNAPAAGSC